MEVKATQLEEIVLFDFTRVDELLFSDVTALGLALTNFTDSYRLLVGAAEELSRTPNVEARIARAAIRRAAALGDIIDLVIAGLTVKTLLVVEVLLLSPAPIPVLVALADTLIEDLCCGDENNPSVLPSLLKGLKQQLKTEVADNQTS